MEKQQGTMKSNGGVAHVHAPMTRGERLELAKLLRVRARVAKADVEQKGARQLADVEAQLASRFKADDARWAAITARAQQMVEKADAEIARLSEESGIRKEFRPSIRLGWFDRGENSVTKRRAELRRVAVSEIESRVKAAKVEIDRQEAAPGGRPKLPPEIVELRALAPKHTPEAVKAIIAVMGDKKAPASARVAAASEILDRGWGRAIAALEHSGPGGGPVAVSLAPADWAGVLEKARAKRGPDKPV